jgi:hypothetical protein
VIPTGHDYLKWTSWKPRENDWDSIFMNKVIVKANAGDFVRIFTFLYFFLQLRVLSGDRDSRFLF